jgi:nitrous oxide reductase accessory protein NosL
MLNFLKVWLGLLMSIGVLYGADISPSRDAKMFRMGQKISHTLCDTKAISSLDLHQPDNTLKHQLQHGMCHDLDEVRIKALIHYLKKDAKQQQGSLPALMPLPKDQKCPVCGMYPYKYPVWASMMVIEKKRYYFDGIKDMMKYFLFEKKYRYDRSHISSMVVQDFYRLMPLDAKKAWYVVGSDIRGPMGKELIPFSSRKDAEIFSTDHHGKTVVQFQQIDVGMLTRY